MPVKGIRVAGRNTQGVRLVNLDDERLVMDVARVVPDDDTEPGEDERAGRSRDRRPTRSSARQSPRSRQNDGMNGSAPAPTRFVQRNVAAAAIFR